MGSLIRMAPQDGDSIAVLIAKCRVHSRVIGPATKSREFKNYSGVKVRLWSGKHTVTANIYVLSAPDGYTPSTQDALETLLRQAIVAIDCGTIEQFALEHGYDLTKQRHRTQQVWTDIQMKTKKLRSVLGMWFDLFVRMMRREDVERKIRQRGEMKQPARVG